MTTASFEGIIPILITPFDSKGRIDADSLKSLVEFNIKAGVHGLGLAIGSEIFKLTEAERAELLRLVVEAVAGRVPVIMNTSANGTDLAIHYARQAKDCGADALMMFPPSFMPVGVDGTLDHFAALAEACDLPVILQDVPQGPIPPALAKAIALRAPQVVAIKVETLPTVPQVAAMAAHVGRCLTVIGGAAGSYMIEEYRRGARGTMPFCSQPEDFLAVWNHLEAGDEAAARARLDSRIMAINRLGAQEGDLFYHLHKQILKRRGIIAHSFVRSPTVTVSKTTQAEINVLLEAF